MNAENNQGVGLKSVMLTIFVVISIVRLFYTCATIDKRSSSLHYDSSSQNRIQHQYILPEPKKRPFTLTYPTYQALSNRSFESLANEQWVKVEKDTFLMIDLQSKLKIPAQWFVQKPRDEKVKYVMKTPEDIQIVFYAFETDGNFINSLYYMRPRTFKTTEKMEFTDDVKEVNYTFRSHGFDYNGSAIGIKENKYLTIFTFEGIEQSCKQLEKFSGKFLFKHLITN